MKRVIHLLTVIILALISASPAVATSVVNTSPTAGSVLSVSPTAVTVKANANLLVGANDLTVIDPNGTRVDDGSVQIQGEVLMVGLKVLKSSGLYTVNYTLMAIDEEPINGSFTFLYNAPDEMALPTPTPSETVLATSSDANHVTDIFVIALMVFAFVLLIFLSRYAKQTFNAPTKARKSSKRASTSKKIIK
jgi:methionine-rich copper-binding protein CopC